MSINKKSEWCTEHKICSFDVDPKLTVRLPALCRFMQEAAYLHAEHLGLGHGMLANEKRAWVLARQRIEIKELPEWGDVVHIRTWPSARDKLFFYRDFEITDQENRLILQASTAWFVMDVEKRERVSSSMFLNADLPEVRPAIFGSGLARLKGFACHGGTPIPVNHGDLDMNGHVNNVRYIEWVLNSLPMEFCSVRTLRSFEANYIAEAACGQTLTICNAERDPEAMDHQITSADAEVFRAKSCWNPV